ncbi:hypothetical protein RGL53_004543 [Vibrio parahaemolyticus]|nr:hypothetical protein [Vibrio parahaemolyticus]
MDGLEIIQLLAAGFALVVSVWNYRGLQDAELKKGYKDKRHLYQSCLDESKSLLQKMHSEIEGLIFQASYFDLLNSSYIGSHGFNEAHKEYINCLREIQTLRSATERLYEELDSVLDSEDKHAFDKCIAIQKNLKDNYLKYVKNYAKAKAQLDGIEKLALSVK